MVYVLNKCLILQGAVDQDSLGRTTQFSQYWVNKCQTMEISHSWRVSRDTREFRLKF